MIISLPPARECLNSGPVLPMLLTLHPAYKLCMALTAPLTAVESFTRTYLRALKSGL